MSKRAATIGFERGMTAQQHAHRLSEHIKDRDANPVQIETPYGIWKSAKNGCGAIDSTTGEWAKPYNLKAKYTGR